MRRSLLLLATLLVMADSARAQEVPLSNWLVPQAASPKTGPALTADATFPLPFIGLPPCRLVDTRGNGAPITGGIYSGGEARSYDFAGLCGIPTSAKALSLNVTVTQALGGGFITVWPKGGALPTVSTVNYTTGQTIANAAVVPTGGANAGVSFVAGVSGTHLIVDVNGYFSGEPATFTNYFRIINNSGSFSIYAKNESTTCGGICGIASVIDSDQDGAIAVNGNASSSTGRGIGVRGIAWGPGSGVSSTNAAGVLGHTISSTAAVHGVRGETVSSNALAAGVAGFTSESASTGGLFHNSGIAPGFTTYLATRLFGTNFGVYTAAEVFCTTLSATTKNFVAPHPEDASKEIVYVSVEAPQADIYFRGSAKLEGGVARIAIPEHFRLSARPGSYMTTLTPVSANPVPLGIESEGPEGIVVRGRSDVRFHYVVYAEREAFKEHDPTPANVHFAPEALARIDPMSDLPESYRALLVQNGTLNPDGTFNRETAARLGWTLPTDLAPRVPPGEAPSRAR